MDKDHVLQLAFEDYKNSPMPTLNQNHIFDRPKFQLEHEAITGQIKAIAEKHGLSFRDLDNYIELQSNELFKG